MGKHQDEQVIVAFGVMTALMLFGLMMKFGSVWPGWVVASTVLMIPIIMLIIFRPSIAKDIWDAIGDRIRGFDDKKPPTPPTTGA
jgi:hypothetical protein